MQSGIVQLSAVSYWAVGTGAAQKGITVPSIWQPPPLKMWSLSSKAAKMGGFFVEIMFDGFQRGSDNIFFKLVENLCISANDNVIFKLCFCALSGNQKTKRRPSISTDTITCKIMQSVKLCKVQNYATFGIAKVFYFALYYQFVL